MSHNGNSHESWTVEVSRFYDVVLETKHAYEEHSRNTGDFKNECYDIEEWVIED
jgi:hypothetical protein